MNNGWPHVLPKNWIWTQVGNVGDIITGNTPPKNDPKNYGDYIPLVKPPELKDCFLEFAEDHLSEQGAKVARLLPPESVLVSCIGNLGKTGINKIPVAFNQQINAVIFEGKISSKYGFYYFQTSEVNKYLNDIASATTIPIVNKSKFGTTPFPIPPLPEQYRIVSKIEELFTKLDAGVEQLKKVKAQLKRYRQAVLKYAFEGKLTQGWREANKDKLEPAAILLERIKEEQSKDGKRKFKGSPSLDVSDLPQLPYGWSWANIIQIADSRPNAIKAGPFGSALRKEFYSPKGFKIYGQEQVIKGNPFYGDYYIDENRYENLKACSVQPGDILISLVGTIGKVLILPEGIEPGIINPRLIKMTLDKRIIINRFFKAYLESSDVSHFLSLLSHGETMDVLNLSILKRLPIPLPPLQEQIVLCDSIERYFSISYAIEKIADQTLPQSERLRQSILKNAFEGKLVPQDPSDEPAEKLLERIKAEKAKKESETKGRRKKSNRMERV